MAAIEQFHPAPTSNDVPASTALSNQSFDLSKELSAMKGPAIAAGIGLASGSALTGLGEIAALKVGDAVARPLLSAGLAMIGGADLASPILDAPAVSSWEALSSFGPEPLVIGGIAGAALVFGAYELDQQLKK